MGRRGQPLPFACREALTTDVERSVARSMRKLPRLAKLNPKAALIVERHIDDWMPATPPGDREAPHLLALSPIPKPRALARRLFAHPVIATGRRKAAS